ncbi:DNA-directed RNA polymerase subunit alpha [Candidatus Parcubacteria bacterium]|nr:DNA-directed RNA polymerase subunit alpha [Candidatus Parcubacteria bacterium]
MNTIALAKKQDYISGKDKNQGSIIIEPLFPGYGVTLGNSLRRVLLSSLSGAAPVGIKIKGVDHEFTTIPNVKEDVLEIILKLKELRIKVFSKETEKLELKVHGKKQVTAADFKKNAQVEIANPKLKICQITDMSGSINLELQVEQGRGYTTIESRAGESQEKKEKEIGYIEMDSIFTPVLKAGISVDNVRVGKMTNWDRLTIDIITDGTITPEEAFEQSVAILLEQFAALVGGSEEKTENRKQKTDSEKGENRKQKGEKDESDVEEIVETRRGVSEDKDDSEKEPSSAKATADKDEPKKKRGRPKKES